MNYQDQYEKLIESARLLPFNGYTEKHHIIPRSLGGIDDESNIISLSAKQHFVAHHLLWKIHRNREMTQAFMLMCNVERDNEKFKITASQYKVLKEDNRKFRSEFMTGRPGNNLGRTLPQEWRDNISKSMIGNKYAVGNTNFKGKTHSEETKKAISEKRKGVPTRTGIPFTQEVKDKMSADRKGKTKIPWTEERKAARREMMRKLWEQRKTPT